MSAVLCADHSVVYFRLTDQYITQEGKWGVFCFYATWVKS